MFFEACTRMRALHLIQANNIEYEKT